MTERYTHVLTPDQIEPARRYEAFMYGTKAAEKGQEKRPARKPSPGASA